MISAERILVIKLSALGDFFQAFGPFAAIRAAHPAAKITLLTTKAFAELARRSPWFDEVWIDQRPKFWQLGRVRALRAQLRGGRFQRVYDLQTSDRSSSYLRLLGGAKAVDWSGIARGCSHPHRNPRRDFMHTLDRQAEQLRDAGIEPVFRPDLSWLEADVSRYGLSKPFVMLVPGGSPHRPDKRWPSECYAELAVLLAGAGVTPVVIGTDSEKEAAEAILSACPQAVSLLGQTSIADMAALARQAAAAVGNDTGPMHLNAGCGCPCVVLYSQASDPQLCGQRGEHVEFLRVPSLHTDLPPAQVMAALQPILAAVV